MTWVKKGDDKYCSTIEFFFNPTPNSQLFASHFSLPGWSTDIWETATEWECLVNFSSNWGIICPRASRMYNLPQCVPENDLILLFFTLHIYNRSLFSTGSMGVLAPAILGLGYLAPAIFGHFITVSQENSINTQHPQC